ncbi:fimbria/pilus periplasmic chaperone [bacterium]|nr:fimbria/pilus periplasmic chaperone [bacterium]MDB4191292.1 fimbria/pilus periplasmic chaperone [Amylibacter sp.]
MLTQFLKQAACGLLFLIIGAGTSSASAINLTPVRVTLSDSQKMGSITVSNRGAKPVIIQMNILGWSQREGEDVFTATRDILANPPIFTIPAGGSQIVRVGLRRAIDTQRELSYRMILEELPPPPEPGLMGAQMSLRISVPVFILPEVTARPVPLWQAIHTPQGGVKITMTNTGNAHIQILNFQLLLPGSTQSWVTKKTSDYVLPGQIFEWTLPANSEYPTPPPGTNIRLIAQTDVGDIEAEVIITP